MDLTPDALAAAGVPNPPLVAEALGALAPFAAALPVDAVVAGLAQAAEPVPAIHGLARLLATAPAPRDDGAVTALLRLLGGSPALATALAAEGAEWPALLQVVLDEPARDAAAHATALAAAGVSGLLSRDDLQRRLRIYRRRELVRIGGRDLLALATVDDTVRELSALAAAVIEAALVVTRARVASEWGGDIAEGFVVMGMGKLGGSELNYSSDVDLVYVYEGDGEHPGGRTVREFFVRIAEEVTRAIAEVTAEGLCFRVDLRLRPGGGEGPLAASVRATVTYYEMWGQTWERAVWLKARPVAGDLALGDALVAELRPFVYRRYLDFGTFEELKAMKRKVDASLRDRGARVRDVKLGRGGIRGVEFWVQAQQLVHGGKDARIRERSTLGGLVRLVDSGYANAEQARGLAAAYRFLRDVEHKLQIVHQRQTQLIPEDPDELRALARRLGFRGPHPRAEFWAAHTTHTTVVDTAFTALFHGPEAERRRDERPELSRLLDELDQEERAFWHLGQLGFRDIEAAYQNLLQLRDGPSYAPASPRRRQAIAALAPTLVGEITRSSAPDRALRHMATFIATVGARTSYLHLLLENPGVMRLLVRLFATSEFLSHFFVRHPELLDSLVRADLVRVRRSHDDLVREIGARLAVVHEFEAELDTLRRFRHEEFLRIGVHDIEAELDAAAVCEQLSLLAEVCVAEAVTLAWREAIHHFDLPPESPTDGLAVLGMGKLGGRELAYHSDLDLIFVYDPGDAAWWHDRVTPHEFFTRVAQRTISALQTPTTEGIAYKIDTRLRPSGNQGPLVSSLESFETYHRTSAALWERQALIRARPIVGPQALVRRLEDTITRFVYGRGLEADELREMVRLRERIEAERGALRPGRVNIKTGWGGLVDIEFVVQMLQLRHGHVEPQLRTRSTRDGLAALDVTGLLPADDLVLLRDGYAFLRQVESRMRIERDQPVEAMDADPDALLALARRLGYGGTDDEAREALRNDHGRHRAEIRGAYARAFAAVMV
ncbi:MAG TPA: bifunctional [glutamate--ammonia ligase]-adenylyl-L-tyrosine phosphorylase/[glutamate--ammonia-ligase] adenylyltransferase [Candidatus Binatia bacterium]|jgi:glutamate-ammonia-ligase adenylyltransferase|nr:bifunctional [glutamate--ammonia ligase]-adenylyl-L-tyrosine phosphorylase/[glutamate--ammonia-ligase] adenylyltransferase [Candidatus Binatia bacterium]